jgi:drug/metabolite transporter (DMT)-like permease
MDAFPLIIVILSALMHASYNFLVKTSNNKTIFIWSMYSFALVIVLTVSPFLPREFLIPGNGTILLYAALSAFFFTFYNIFAGKAYSAEKGDLSVSYPLSTTAPVYIPIWAHFVLGETISLQAISGILTVVMGTYLIQLNSSIAHFRLKKISFRNKAVRYALFAGFLYSFGAIADKIGVMRSNFFVFTSCVILLMFSYFTAVVLSSSRLRADLFQSYRTSPFRVMLSGVALYISFYLFRYALSITEVSYAASVRQVASLFGVFLGIYILKEPYGRIRLIATLFIILGIVLITLG